MTKPLLTLASHSFLVYCPQEAEDTDGAGFWSNSEGWTSLASATLFTEFEKEAMHLPLGDGSYWMRSPTAARRCLITSVMAELRAYGYDVIPGPSGGWSWASAEGSGPDDDAFPTEGAAWAALAQERQAALAASGLAIDGLFDVDPDAFIVPHYMAREIEGPLWTADDGSGMPAVVLMSLEDTLAEARDYLCESGHAVSEGMLDDGPTEDDIELISDLGEVITMAEALAMFPAADMPSEPSACDAPR